MSAAEIALIVLGVMTTFLLVVIAWQEQRHHREHISAMGKLNHSIANVAAAVHLMRTDPERR